MTDIDIDGLKAKAEKAEAAKIEAQSHTAYYAKTLIALRDTLFIVADDLQDEGDRVYFGSTNDADRLKDISGRIDDLAWEEILADSQPPLNLYDAIERGNAEREALGEELEATKSREAELIAQRAELLEALTHEAKNCPMCKGRRYTASTFDHIIGTATGNVICPRCKPTWALISRATQSTGEADTSGDWYSGPQLEEIARKERGDV